MVGGGFAGLRRDVGSFLGVLRVEPLKNCKQVFGQYFGFGISCGTLFTVPKRISGGMFDVQWDFAEKRGMLDLSWRGGIVG